MSLKSLNIQNIKCFSVLTGSTESSFFFSTLNIFYADKHDPLSLSFTAKYYVIIIIISVLQFISSLHHSNILITFDS
jgi:hypothetical protein